jgi:hypothetical protein
MASRVTYSTVFSQSWQNVYDVVNNRTYVPDPSGGTGRKFVYSREPDVKAISFAGFPYVVVNGSGATFDKKSQSLDRKRTNVSFSAQIDIVTCDRGFGASDGQGFSQLNTICDNIAKTFNDATVRRSLQANSLSFANVDASEVVVEEFHNTLVYRRTLIVTFQTRMAVSA